MEPSSKLNIRLIVHGGWISTKNQFSGNIEPIISRFHPLLRLNIVAPVLKYIDDGHYRGKDTEFFSGKIGSSGFGNGNL